MEGHSCLNCGKPLKNTRNTKLKYCSIPCQQEYQFDEFIKRWKEGLEVGWTGKTKGLSKMIRKYLLKKHNNSCSICGWSELHPVDGKPLVEIDHIDGNAENCSEDNLRVLCPNCHAMTPTFRARNKVSSRSRNC